MKRQPKYRPRWHRTEFGLLLPGYYFKSHKLQVTWWVKKDHATASSENGGLEQPWHEKDMVWIDLNQSLYRHLKNKDGTTQRKSG